ncbi:N-acetylneuraminate synthase family protein [Calothrix sp. NIES-2098]|uniref:N-acetylneuraminate synthase family protein n=1 Tax=Calothrix sp. NIES-2098 TaxID=1954171 RepID=UPI000B5DD166|nr:Sialic acid synthase [Calothrix sp. NIES-2098]
MSDIDNRLLFILEMANNHSGSLEHGLEIIRQFAKIKENFTDRFQFGFKLQYRDLDTFIHPNFQNRFDLKYIKRFSETRLTEAEFILLVEEIEKLGFIKICTPFDENSVKKIEAHNFDIIKIASCSLTDWPLLERIAQTNKPIIASTAGVELEEIDKVVSFFLHREKNISLMHCVGEYPTREENLQLNQIELLKQRYPQIRIGYSTHENPDNTEAVKIAVAKGATIFEKHVGIVTQTLSLNNYSANATQVKKWLESAQVALNMCGVIGQRQNFSEIEKNSLFSLRRGVFAKYPIKKGEKVDLSNTFLAIPTTENQITANDMSKYTYFYAEEDLPINQAILSVNTKRVEIREQIYEIIQKVKKLLKKSRVVVPQQLEFEISHHYGIEKFHQFGCTLINYINREYCKKLIVVLPGQSHPEQYHKIKEETFIVQYGDVKITINGEERRCKAGDIVTIERGAKHTFSSENGTVLEEISSTHYQEDSYYTDPNIADKKDRKTQLTYWIN